MMKKVMKHLILIIILLLFLTSVSFLVEDKHDILYISSYSPSFMTFDDQIKGISSILTEKEYNLSIQYMDTKAFYSEALIDDFKNQIKKKMQMSAFDAVVVADDNAYNFALQEKDDLFKHLPIIFLGVNNKDNALKANKITNISGVIEHASIQETIDIGLKLQNDSEIVYVLVDPTPSGQGDLKTLETFKDRYPERTFKILDSSDMDFDQYALALEKISSKDLILFLSLYRDEQGNSFLFSESVDFVLKNTNAPIFHPYKHGIGEGMVGGKVVDHYQQGRFAGLLVKDYFDQGSLKDIAVIESSPNTYYFDAEAMETYGLDINLLPEEATIINNEVNFYQKYRSYIISFTILFIFEAFLIFYLLYNLKKRRAYERELIKANDLLEMQNEEIKAQYDELEETKIELDISRSRYILAFEGSNSGIFDQDFVKNSNYINADWYNQYLLDDSLGDHDDFSKLIAVIPKENREAYYKMKNKIYQSNDRIYDIEFYIQVDGSNVERWIHENGVIIRNNDGEVTRVIGSHREITHLKMNMERIKDLKVYDQLTKLYNRSALEIHLKKLLSTLKNTKIAIILVDLDNFKYINDQYGHNRGDELLKVISNRLIQNNVAEYISRFGGDEFVLVLNNVESIEGLIDGLYDIKYFIEKKIIIQSEEYHMSASFGVVLSPDHGKDYHELIRKADLAMYQVKKTDNNTWYRIYDESINEAFKNEVQRIQDIKYGIKNDEFYMVFQPIVDCMTEEIITVESLMRWEHNGEFISPNEFIPLAEESGLIYELGLVSILESIRMLKTVNGAINVSINLSPIQLKDPNLMDLLEKTIEAHDVPYEKIIIEITETAVIENFDVTIKVLNRMKSLGLRIAFDDFGTGYSSLSYLTKLPVDYLKIDRSFVQLINEKDDTMALVEAIVAIAKSRQLEVVFEGVETKEQKNFIIKSGCRFAQGYYYFKPMGVEDLKELI